MKSVLVKDYIANNDLSECLSDFFSFEVKPLRDVESLSSNAKSDSIVFESVPLQGDFSFELCIYTDAYFDTEKLAYLICKRFNTEVLMSDNDINPYSWILVTKEGKSGTVKQVVREDDIFLIQR